MNIKLREKKAFTLVEIMIVVAIIGLLIAIALPNFVRARNNARKNLCFNNLRLLGHAAEQFIIDNNLADTTVVTTAQAGLYVKGGLPAHPGAGGVYTIGSEGAAGSAGATVTCTGGAHPGVSDPAIYHTLTGQVTTLTPGGG